VTLPAVTLLLGDPARGWEAAAEMSKPYPVWDTVIIRDLDTPTAKEVVTGAQQCGTGSERLIVILLDGATMQAQNVLLKVLEEPPPDVRFILIASRRPLSTVVSRSQVVPVGGAPPRQAASSAGEEELLGAVLRAASCGDWVTATRLFARSWTAAHSRQLHAWANEAVSGRWRSFSAELAPAVSRDEAAAIWVLVSALPDSPSLSIAALRRAFA
jgi:DNA polymerase III, delta subunit